MKKIKNGRKLLALLLVFLLTITITGCGDDGGGKKTAKEQSGSRGRYVEQRVSFDKGGIITLNELEDGKIRVLANTGVYDSSDQGESWTEWEGIPEEMRSDMTNGYLNSAVISRKGSIFYSIGEAYKLIMPDGSMKPVLLESFMEGQDKEVLQIWQVDFTESGDLLCMGQSKIYQLDSESLSVKHIYGEAAQDESQNIESIANRTFCATGDRLYVVNSIEDVAQDGTSKLGSVNVEGFDMTTGDSLGRQEILEQFLKQESQNLFSFVLLPEQTGTALYLVGQDGIYRWQTDGSAVEKIFNGELGQMLSESVLGGAAFGEASLMLLYPDNESETPYDEPVLYKYVYDPDAPLQPDKTLTVYSMYEDHTVRQAITAFRQKNTDVAVTYEVGITGQDAVTRTDALKILNTNIMAGKGPDVLMLEGMPIESYLEKGILMDISDVVQEVDSTDGIFKNIAGAYKKEDSIGAVPTSFAVPLIYGKENLLAQAGDIEGLAAAAEALRAENPDAVNVLGDITPVSMLKCLTAISSPAWISEGRTIDKEKLVQFLDAAKRIVDAQGNIDGELIGELEEDNVSLDLSPFMSSVSYIAHSIGFTNAQISLGNLENSRGLMQMVSMLRKMGDSGFTKATGQFENVFIPLKIVGVSAKSADTDTAKAFVRYLLTGNQNKSGEGWPVNKAAFEKAQEKPDSLELGVINPVNDVDGSTYELEWVWPTEDDFQELKSLIDSLTTPTVTDEMINRTVLREGMKCLRGEISSSEAAETIFSNVNLYLAE